MILYIRKRNGQKALFNPDKIKNAIKKAFIAKQIPSKEGELDTLVQKIIVDIETKYLDESVPSVEHTQDIVESTLMREGYLDAARAYILYRAKHQIQREEQTLTDIQEHKLMILDESGQKIPFSQSYFYSKLRRLATGLENIDLETLIAEISKGIYADMPLVEVNDMILNCVKQRIESHYDYSYLASHIVLDRLYKNILNSEFGLDDLQDAYEANFEQFLTTGIEFDLLDGRLKEFDLKAISKALVADRDKNLMYLGTQTINDRYLLRSRNRERTIFELPQYMWMRVAMGLALLEDDKTKWSIEFYNQLSELNVLSSTPTLFNSGTTHSQMSSCYLNTVEDSMEGIFKNYSDNAQLSKWAGGIGTNWTSVRSKNAFIRGTNGRSQGIIPFLKIYNDIALAVNQGGKRKGAMAAYLDCWHLDIEEFLELKKNTGDERRRAHDIHTAIFVSDLFMKRVDARKKWTLFSPDTTPDLIDAYGKNFDRIYEEYEKQDLPAAKTVDALDLWKKMLTMLYETGHPWITFKDAINVRSPQDHVGVVRNSNLCTEITLNTSKDETAVCNLASINLARMITDGQLNEDRIRSTVSIAMRMLDNVVDNNFYPIIEAKNSNLKHRPVGLGMMGYQDALYKMKIDFDSDENVEFADRSMELISHAAILSSSKLAAERGAYESFPGSKWDRGILPLDTLDLLQQERGREIKVSRESHYDWSEVRESIKKHGMRNSNTMAIAPTATISNIAGTVPCVEPIFKNIYMKENLSGNFIVLNRYLLDALKEIGLWNDEILTKIKVANGSVLNIEEIPLEIRHRFKETFEIEPTWLLRAAARRSKWIDQAASTNIFLKTTSGRILSDTYTQAWEMGLKTTYYLRTLAASQVTKMSGIENTEQAPAPKAIEKAVTPTTTPEIKLCSIDDPDCEACQ